MSLFAAAPVHAAASDKEDLRVRVGLGVQALPDFVGGRGHELGPLFDLDVASGSEPFAIETPDDSFGFGLLRLGRLTVGPAAGFDSSRTEAEVGARVGKVKATVKLGGFADYLVGDDLRLHGELLKGVNGHEGLSGQIGVDRFWRDGDRYVFTLGPRLMISDARYSRAFFGVTPAAALASGLPVYRPSGGIHAVALTGGMSGQLSGPWGLFGYARAERLVGDAARSPIVRTYGSRNQLSVGVGLNYEFRVKR